MSQYNWEIMPLVNMSDEEFLKNAQGGPDKFNGLLGIRDVLVGKENDYFIRMQNRNIAVYNDDSSIDAYNQDVSDVEKVIHKINVVDSQLVNTRSVSSAGGDIVHVYEDTSITNEAPHFEPAPTPIFPIALGAIALYYLFFKGALL